MDCNFTVIPHFNQAYLNSIIISLIFSEYFKKIISEKSKYLSNSNLFKSFILKLIESTDTKKIYSKTTPIDLLLSLNIKSYKTSQWTPEHISYVYNLLNITNITLLFDSFTNNYIIKTDDENLKDKLTDTPDVIILYHSKLHSKSKILINKYHEFYKKNPNKAIKYNSIYYDYNFIGIDNYDDVISLNDDSYELELCILNNPTATIGFKCNNEKYVYNYFNFNILSNCSIIKYNWNQKKSEMLKEKCFNNKTCNLPQSNISCFSFNNDDKILIYVKKGKKITSYKSMKTIQESASKSMKSIQESASKSMKSIKESGSKSMKTIKEPSKTMKDDKDYIIKLLVSKLKKNS
jgi:hypothetical protein